MMIKEWLAYYDEETRQICVKPFSVPLSMHYKHVGISIDMDEAVAIVKVNLRCEAKVLKKRAAILESVADRGGGESTLLESSTKKS